MASHIELAMLADRAYGAVHMETKHLELIRAGWTGDSLGLFAIRGSNELADWIGNLRQLPWYYPDIGWAPSGFIKPAQIVADLILAHRYPNTYPIALTGHSRGGAVAILVAAFLRQRGVPVTQVVTFGAPGVGRLNILADVPVTQYAIARDIVPRLSPYPHQVTPTVLGHDRFSWWAFRKNHHMGRYLAAMKELQP